MSSNKCGPKLDISQRYISRRSQTCIFSVSPFFTLHENVRFGSIAAPSEPSGVTNLRVKPVGGQFPRLSNINVLVQIVHFTFKFILR